MGRYSKDYDPDEFDYANTAHDFDMVSRSGEFIRGSKWNSEISGGRSAINAKAGEDIFRDTFGGPQSNKLHKDAARQYPKRAKNAVTKSNAFIPNINVISDNRQQS